MSVFEAECQQVIADINGIYSQLNELRQQQQAHGAQINKLADRIAALAAAMDEAIELPPKLESPPPDILRPALAALPEAQQKELTALYLHSAPKIPPLDATDRAFIWTVGLLAVLADWVLVGLPAAGWLVTNKGQAVPVGLVSQVLQDLSTRADNPLAKLVKVPYDRSITRGLDTGLSPVNHRLLSFGHDPSPVGFITGMLDILSGGMTAVTKDGLIYHLPGIPVTKEKMILAPLLWLGHLISDVFTPMGLPVPGMVLTQLLQIPVNADGTTLARLGYHMYVAGYDTRHYLVGGIVPGLIEILVRAYCWLRDVDDIDEVNPNYWRADEQTTQQRRAKLQAMLFWANAIAITGNAGKVAVVAGTANFYTAVTGINIIHWQLFALQFMKYIAVKNRDTTLEQIRANRQRLNAARAQVENAHPLYHYDYAGLASIQIGS